jgi:hypothetical protein
MVITQPVKTDHRWFIWTVLFLIVSGVSLVSYIMITTINQDAANYENVWLPTPRTNKK